MTRLCIDRDFSLSAIPIKEVSMKVIKLSECEMGEYYFFVYNSVVHYGYASQKYNDIGVKPTIFCSEGVNICDIDCCSLVYQL